MRALTKSIRLSVLSFAAFMLPAMTAYAGSQTGTIVYLIARDSDGLTYFSLTGTPTGRPACASGPYWMIKNENTESGKRQYAMLLLAYSLGKTITVGGANTCTRWSDGEDVDGIVLQP